MKSRPNWLTLAAAPALLLSGCSLIQSTVSPSVKATERSDLERKVYPGMAMNNAEANIQALGFNCQPRSGSYFDDAGQEHSAESFIACVKRPASISFYCDERTAVTLVPDGDRVGHVVISKAPSCHRN
ncbi:MAG: hypothetical protein KGJ55_08930 [Gammaproteobacteria bacterium]|nr:hypothetical protein [Gammaproteobacteria bacterium]